MKIVSFDFANAIWCRNSQVSIPVRVDNGLGPKDQIWIKSFYTKLKSVNGIQLESYNASLLEKCQHWNIIIDQALCTEKELQTIKGDIEKVVHDCDKELDDRVALLNKMKNFRL